MTKLYLLEEENLYNDCLEKNKEAFPFKIFNEYMKKSGKNFSINDYNKMNIIDICKNINDVDLNYKEELKMIEHSINNSEWKKIINQPFCKINNINLLVKYFFDLYNFKNDNNSNNDNEPKYSVFIPIFISKKILNPITIIGDLNKPQYAKRLKGYLCIKKNYIIRLDKSILKPDDKMYQYFGRKRVDEAVEKLFKNHFIFKNIEIDYLSKNFGKYFQKIILKKNDVLFEQDELQKGIYIIVEGLIQLKTFRSYYDMAELNFNLLYGLVDYPEYMQKIMSDKFLNSYYRFDNFDSPIMKHPLFFHRAKEKTEIIFCEYIDNDILGLGEVYNNKTGVNIFSAKCISDRAELFFLPREMFKGLIANDKINNKCGEIIEGKIYMLQRCIKKFKSHFENKVLNLIKSKSSKKLVQLNYKGINEISKLYNTLTDKFKNPTTYDPGLKVNLNKNSAINLKKYEENKTYNYISENKYKNLPPTNQNKSNSTRIDNPIIETNYKLNNISTFYDQNFFGNFKGKECKERLIKSSKSFYDDKFALKKRLEDIANYYRGKSSQKPIMVQDLNNELKFNNNTSSNVLTKQKINTEKALIGNKIKERYYSANRIKKNMKNIFIKVRPKTTNKFFNNYTRIYKERNGYSNKKIGNQKKNSNVINKFSPTNLFPNIINNK